MGYATPGPAPPDCSHAFTNAWPWHAHVNPAASGHTYGTATPSQRHASAPYAHCRSFTIPCLFHPYPFTASPFSHRHPFADSDRVTDGNTYPDSPTSSVLYADSYPSHPHRFANRDGCAQGNRDLDSPAFPVCHANAANTHIKWAAP